MYSRINGPLAWPVVAGWLLHALTSLQKTPILWAFLRHGPLKHCQFPAVASLVAAKNVEITVVAFDLEVVIVAPRPSIDGFDDFDDTSIQPDARQLLNAAIAGIALDLYPHGPTPSLPSAMARLNAAACS